MLLYLIKIIHHMQKRDNEIQKWCQSKEIKCVQAEDYLAPIGTIVKGDGSPYTVFTPLKMQDLKFQCRKLI